MLLLAALAVLAAWWVPAASPAGAQSTPPPVVTSVPSRLAVGAEHACVVALDGSLSCWGTDQYFTLGRGAYAGDGTSRFPGRVATAGTILDGKRIKEVAAGWQHTCALTTDGQVACWGANFGRMLGAGTAGAHSFTPLALDTAGTVLDGKVIDRIFAGGGHTCALTTDHLLACWGANGEGQLGNGTTSEYGAIAAVHVEGTPLSGKKIVSVSAGVDNTCALTSDGTAACWGDGEGLGTGSHVSSPVPVAPGRNAALPAGPIRTISVGTGHVCAATFAGALACWGENGDGELGDGTDITSLAPVSVAVAATPLAGERVVELDAGHLHTCARTERGRLACWGSNFAGELGTGTTIDSPTPIGVVTAGTPLAGVDISQIAVGYQLSCAIGDDGATACWGTAVQGSLGRGTWDNSSLPVAPLVPTAPGDVTALPGDGKVRVSWSPSTSPYLPVSGYAVVPFIGGVAQAPVLVGPTETSTVVTGLPNDASLRFRVIARTDAISGPGSPATAAVVTRPTSTFVPVTPCRVVDTRLRGGRLADREQRTFAVSGGGSAFAAQGGKAGGCGIPAGAVAVEAAVTAVDPSGSGFARAWPVGRPMPNATFLNIAAGRSRTNTGALSLATAGSKHLALRNFGSTAHYVIDVQGYYLDQSKGSGAGFVPLRPCRLADSRQVKGGPFADREARSYVVAGSGASFAAQGGKAGGCGVPDGAVAVELSVTVIAEGDGFTRLWPSDGQMPNATFLNSKGGEDLTNTGAVKLATTGATDLTVRNFGGAADVVLDVQGYFAPASDLPPASAVAASVPAASAYVPMAPCRIIDTRVAGGPFTYGGQRSYRVTGTDGFPAQGGSAGGCGVPSSAVAAELTFTAVDPKLPGFLRAYPAQDTTPDATILNFAQGSSTTNTGTVALGPSWSPDRISLHSYGSTDYVVEIQGYYLPLAEIPA